MSRTRVGKLEEERPLPRRSSASNPERQDSRVLQAATQPQGPLGTPTNLLALQRLVGNRGVANLVGRPDTIQRLDDDHEDLSETLRQALKQRRLEVTGGDDEREPQLPQRQQLEEANRRNDLAQTLRAGLGRRRAQVTGQSPPEDHVEERAPSSPVSDFKGQEKLTGTQRLKMRLGPMSPIDEVEKTGPENRPVKGPVRSEFESAQSEHRQSVTTALLATGEENRKKQARSRAEETPAFVTAKKYAGTALEPEEYAAVVRAIDSPELNFEAALTDLRTVAKLALDKAAEDRRKIDLERATKHEVYKAPYLAQADEVAARYIAEKDWISAPASVTSLRKKTALVLSAIGRFATASATIKELIDELDTFASRTQAAKVGPRRGWVLPSAPVLNEQKSKNLSQWLEEHRAAAGNVGTEEQFEALVSTTKPGLGFLEDKIRLYEESAVRSVNAQEAERLAQEAERQRQQERTRLRNLGLIGGTGQTIQEKEPSDFGGHEQTSIEAAVNNFRNNTGIPALTHPNGAKWGAPFGNRDRDLPTGHQYTEYYVQKAPGSSTYHGNRRLVITGTWIYYTNTHYGENGDPPFYKLK